MLKFGYAALGAMLALALAPGLRAEEPPLPAPPPPPPAPPAVVAADPAQKVPVVSESHQPQTMDEALAQIPGADLDDAVFLEAGKVTIPYRLIEDQERAQWLAHKKREPGWDFKPGEEIKLRKQIAVSLLANKMIETYAADNNLAAPDDKYKEVFDRFKSNKAKRGYTYEQQLADSGITDADLQRSMRASLAIQLKMAGEVPDDDVVKTLESTRDKLKIRRASDIMFSYKGASGANEKVLRPKEEAKKQAEILLKKLRETGGDFERLARDMSDSPTADHGGDMGFIPKSGDMIESVSEAVYKLEKKGSLSEVVESPFGFHIILLTDIRSDADLKNDVREQLVKLKVLGFTQKLTEEAVKIAKFNNKHLKEHVTPPEKPDKN